MGYLNRVRHFLEQPLRSTDQPSAILEPSSITSAKGQSEDSASAVSCAADEVARMLALGARIKGGDIGAVRCGATGKKCVACGGMPCLGSQPWEDD